jgi:Electron transfer DM13
VDLLGEFGREFFGALYDYRLPIAVASAVIAVSIVVVAWRRGWIAAARRHPGRSAIALAAALAVGGPLTWYLASPIWIRTSLVEAGPTAAPAIVSTPAPSVAPSAPTAPPPSEPSTAPTPMPTPFVPATVASGRFAGTDEFHFGRGTASIVEVEPGRYHLRLDDFSVRNGPDLYVYLSTDAGDYADDALEVGLLKATDGSFGYDLPAGTDPSRFRSAIIWCKQFSHLFAVAPF